MDLREPVSWIVSLDLWWVLLEVIWNRVPLSCWVGDTFVDRFIWYCFSSVECWEGMGGAFHLDSWTEVGILQLILEFDKSCRWRRQTQFGSGQISGNQLYVYWRFVCTVSKTCGMERASQLESRVVSWWVLLEVSWNRVLCNCWVVDTFDYRLVWYFSSVKCWEECVVHSGW